MDLGSISSRYAKALYGFAVDCGMEDQVYDEMSCFSAVSLKNPGMKDFFEDPIASDADKIKILITAAGIHVSKVTERFMHFVVEKKKEIYMLFIAASYQNLYRKRKKIILAEITTAKEMDQAYIESIVELIGKKYKPKQSTIQLNVKTNPDLIGGFVLKAENYIMDASVRGELKRIRKDLNVEINKKSRS